MAVPVCGNNISIKLVPWPGRRLGGGARCVGTRLARDRAFINWNIHRLLFDDWSASVGELRGGRGRTGLVVVKRLGVSAVICLVGLLWVTRIGLHQSGLKTLNTLNVRFLVYLDRLTAISTLVGPQLRGEKCIGGVVVVAIVQIVVVTIYWVCCRGLASWGEASPCIVGRVWIDVVV